ncbi:MULTISPECIES: serine O-acetyltransferase [Sphingomonas]|jgi:serine O-acetyltransferase|uniref:Serine acetyltransferase n=1 Tax=Sphingomonas zeae TaxID=1646122 RepID=A0A7Y6EGU3_9SPHN|nr:MULTISPECIES: serine acetyltransferase [Sphingomonas]MBB4046720.1 serine O-acetyltransferase [Sphingomonas zeae]MDK8184497.1 serine acetyltransferase [Sphingomonas zeae]MDK8214414.1 serine acetyltransferase [Sphingomonas sp. UMB7805-LC452B]NUU48829.1 serine acetyltransferase [Sphingomonas zeae]
MSHMGAWAHIREDRTLYREGWLAQGLWALAIHRLSAGRFARRRGVVRSLWGVAAKLAGKWAEFACGISLPETATIGRRLRIEHFGGIVVHGSTVIGDDCVLRQNVTLGNRSEARPLEAPILGNRVQIGAGAVVLGAVRIGDGAIIGANAVVLSDVPAGAIAVGNPARIIERASV